MTADNLTVPTITLHDGTSIPQLGLGVFQVPPEETAQVVEQALEVGYRHIDTAQMYQNEQGVGDALKKAGVPREDLYITSKLNNGFHRPDDARHGIATEAWSPIAQGAVNDDEQIGAIADAHGRTRAQVVLRWHVQRGDIVFPKTTKVERMRENAAIFDFELTADQMATIDGLDRGEEGRRGPNPDTFDYIPD
jgi:diketogulonate reductase-like aldo/keto reductase